MSDPKANSRQARLASRKTLAQAGVSPQTVAVPKDLVDQPCPINSVERELELWFNQPAIIAQVEAALDGPTERGQDRTARQG